MPVAVGNRHGAGDVGADQVAFDELSVALAVVI